MMAAPPNMMANIATHPSTRSHSYYNPPPTSYVSPNIMLTHLPPPPTPSPLTPSPLSSQPPSMLPSQQTYYQNSFATNTPPPLPVPYPHLAINELTATASAVASTCSSTAVHTSSGHHQHRADVPEQESTPTSYPYDYHGQHHHSIHTLHTPVDEIPIPSDDQAPTYADSHHSYEYEKSVASTAASSVTSAHEQQQLLQQLQQHQLLLQEQQQQEQEQQQQQQQEQQPLCSAKELSAAIAAVATVDLTKLKLPPKWKAVRDSEGRIYYYHTKTRVSQWYPPQWEEPAAAEVVEQVEEGDYSSEEESSADEEDEVVETRKRRRSSKYDHVNVFAKRLHRDGGEKDKEQSSFDVSSCFSVLTIVSDSELGCALFKANYLLRKCFCGTAIVTSIRS